MKTAVLKVQTKGQVMLPKEWRADVTVFQAIKDDDVIILTPVHIASDKEVLSSAARIMKKNSKLLKSLANR